MKQEYKKPQVVKVNLKVEQTVLSSCKLVVSDFGPGVIGCEVSAGGCSDITQPS